MPDSDLTPNISGPLPGRNTSVSAWATTITTPGLSSYFIYLLFIRKASSLPGAVFSIGSLVGSAGADALASSGMNSGVAVESASVIPCEFRKPPASCGLDCKLADSLQFKCGKWNKGRDDGRELFDATAAIAARQVTLLSDLEAAGFPVDSVHELRTSGARYPAAVPILLAWLPLTTDLWLKESIVRTLSVPWAKPDALRPMITLFRSDPVPGTAREELVRWAVGNALEVLYDDKEFDSVAELVLEKKFGTARQMVVLALGKSKKPEAVDVLLRIIDDPDVEGQVVSALGKLKSPTTKSALESKLDHPMTWIRKAAQRGLARLP